MNDRELTERELSWLAGRDPLMAIVAADVLLGRVSKVTLAVVKHWMGMFEGWPMDKEDDLAKLLANGNPDYLHDLSTEAYDLVQHLMGE